MSDRLLDLKLKLKNVVNAVKDVTNWKDLGLQLDLEESTLALIASQYGVSANDCRREMLSTWLKFDPKASWEKLACALTAIGENVVAANVRSQYAKVVSQMVSAETSSSLTEDDQTCMFIYRYLLYSRC